MYRHCDDVHHGVISLRGGRHDALADANQIRRFRSRTDRYFGFIAETVVPGTVGWLSVVTIYVTLLWKVVQT